MDTFNENIINIENILRDGDQIMIWKGGYQTTFKGMGSTNHAICRENEEKSTYPKKSVDTIDTSCDT